MLGRSNSERFPGRSRVLTEVAPAGIQARGIQELLGSPEARRALQGEDFARWRGVPVGPAGGYFELAPLRDVNAFSRGLRAIRGASTSRQEAYIPAHGYYRLNHVLVFVVTHVPVDDPGIVTLSLVENTSPTRPIEGQELSANLAHGSFIFAAAASYDLPLQEAPLMIDGAEAGMVQRMFGIRTVVMGSEVSGAAVSIYPMWSAEFPFQAANFNRLSPTITFVDRFNRDVGQAVSGLRSRFRNMRPQRISRGRSSFQSGRISLEPQRAAVVTPPPVVPSEDGSSVVGGEDLELNSEPGELVSRVCEVAGSLSPVGSAATKIHLVGSNVGVEDPEVVG